MVSLIQNEDTNATANQLMYCHSCSYEFSKSQNSLFECPRCKQDFIEEVNDSVPQRSDSPDFLQDFLSRINYQQPDINHLMQISVVVNSVNGNREIIANRMNRIGHGHSGPIFVSQLPIEDMLNFMSPPSHPVMTVQQLQEIPKATITHEQTQIQCAICFDNFTLNENEVRQLQCNHLYHEKCIFPWVEYNGTCPVCRAPLPDANLENNLASSSSFHTYIETYVRNALSQQQPINNQGPSTSTSATPNRVLQQLNESSSAQRNAGPSTFHHPVLSSYRRHSRVQRDPPPAATNAVQPLTPPFRVHRSQRNYQQVETGASTSRTTANADQSQRDRRPQRKRSRLPESAQTSTLSSLPNRFKRKRSLRSHLKVDTNVISLSSSSDDDTSSFEGPSRKRANVTDDSESSDDTIIFEGPSRKQAKITEDSDSSS